MKILMLAPAHASCARGNLVTVERWRKGLVERGHVVEVRAPDVDLDQDAIAAFDLVHAHHAVHCGPKALELRSRGLPVVVSLGGTDLNGGPEGGPDPAARRVYEGADRIVGPFAEDAERLGRSVPEAAAFRLVRRGIEVPDAAHRVPGTGLLGLMAGGIREVKGQLRALAWLTRLREQGLDLELEIAGPEIEVDYARRFKAELELQPAAHYLGVLGPGDVHTRMASASFLLNASLHEGASNALLEALALGCPVAATRVAGNRQMLAQAPDEVAHLIDPDEDGLERFRLWLTRLATADLATQAELARAFVRRHFDVRDEIRELESVYREVATAAQ